MKNKKGKGAVYVNWCIVLTRKIIVLLSLFTELPGIRLGQDLFFLAQFFSRTMNVNFGDIKSTVSSSSKRLAQTKSGRGVDTKTNKFLISVVLS